jgi:DNA-binding ferritin-like protein
MERSLKKQKDKTLQRPNRVHEMTAMLVQELMNAATSFHKLHLKVTGPGSYAQHMALGQMYESLPKLADGIAEGFQGACESILHCNPKPYIYLNDVKHALEYMREMHSAISELQLIMPYSEITNQLDLVKDLINSVKYKLLFLS